jgi:hypothetical protein
MCLVLQGSYILRTTIRWGYVFGTARELHTAESVMVRSCVWYCKAVTYCEEWNGKIMCLVLQGSYILRTVIGWGYEFGTARQLHTADSDSARLCVWYCKAVTYFGRWYGEVMCLVLQGSYIKRTVIGWGYVFDIARQLHTADSDRVTLCVWYCKAVTYCGEW